MTDLPDIQLDADQIESLFTRPDGSFLCARWGRPVAPVVFGLTDESLEIFRTAIRAGYAHAGHPVVDTDPEMGANLLLFFVGRWEELAGLPDLDHLTGLPDLPSRLVRQQANQYRLFRFDNGGGIRACLSFVNMGGSLADAHPAALAEHVTMQSTLTFSNDIVPSAALAGVIRAAYDPVLPVVATDRTHALRLAARTT
ncbi:hypothetical protein [Paracoccus sp. (in: a-proteobacteria)]|uniref:hypothetical protein n=1 Tax=Paracoccus sp. TaxID=267 RepID=UPI00396CE408